MLIDRLQSLSAEDLSRILITAYDSRHYRRLDGIGRANIFGIRAAGGATNRFDDVVGLLRQIDTHFAGLAPDEPLGWTVDLFQATTDPGRFWLENPARVQGTAILVPGQYVNSHEIGMHQGKYRALVQRRPMRFYRDNTKDAVINLDPATIENDVIGCNIHLAREGSGNVEKWSAACQVIYGEDRFAEFLKLIDLHIQLGWEDTFTYTLFEEKELGGIIA